MSSPVSNRKPPPMTLKQGTWFVENYVGTVVEVTEVQRKQNVFIHNCDDCTVVVSGAEGGLVKSITVDASGRIRVVFGRVISVVEVIHVKRSKILPEGQLPVFQVDKSAGVELVLGAEHLAAPPQIFTSVSSEITVSWPAEGREDPVTMGIPEQYITLLQDGALVTEPVRHHG